MRPRIPLAYASLLIIALVAVVGLAAFTPTASSPAEQSEAAPASSALVVSARIASAVLAVRVTEADPPLATTTPQTTPVTSTTQEATSTTQPEATTSTDPPPSDTAPPALAVTSHSDGDEVHSSYIVFSGTSEPGAYVRSGPFDADTNDDGTWSIGLVMIDGANRAIFTAIDAAGNTTEVRLTIYYAKPKPTTTTTHVDSHTHTTTTTHAHTTTTTKPTTQTNWSPLWPADAGGIRDVEAWRALVEKYWAADRVDCVLGIIKKESRGDPRAYNSSSAAEGLMQHLSKYWKNRAAAAGFRDSNGLYASPYNAEANIAAGAQIAGSGSGWYTPWGYTAAYGSCVDSRG